MIPRAALACIGFVATAYLGLVERARASELWLVQGYGPRAVEPCNPSAEALDGVAGAGSCLRFGGRVRVDLGAQGQSQAGPETGAAPAAVRADGAGDLPSGRLDVPHGLGSGVTRSHLRVPSSGSAGTFDPASAR